MKMKTVERKKKGIYTPHLYEYVCLQKGSLFMKSLDADFWHIPKGILISKCMKIAGNLIHVV